MSCLFVLIAYLPHSIPKVFFVCFFLKQCKLALSLPATGFDWAVVSSIWSFGHRKTRLGNSTEWTAYRWASSRINLLLPSGHTCCVSLIPNEVSKHSKAFFSSPKYQLHWLSWGLHLYLRQDVSGLNQHTEAGSSGTGLQEPDLPWCPPCWDQVTKCGQKRANWYNSN